MGFRSRKRATRTSSSLSLPESRSRHDKPHADNSVPCRDKRFQALAVSSEVTSGARIVVESGSASWHNGQRGRPLSRELQAMIALTVSEDCPWEKRHRRQIHLENSFRRASVPCFSAATTTTNTVTCPHTVHTSGCCCSSPLLNCLGLRERRSSCALWNYCSCGRWSSIVNAHLVV